MIEIALASGLVTIIDDDDADRVSKYRWTSLNNHGRGFYARATIHSATAKSGHSSLMLHRFIAGAKHGEVVDHINRNGLDNRKENLRIATRSTNAANSKHRCDRSTSPYRGVYKRGSIYRVEIRVNTVLHRLGSYICPKEAALVYDYAAWHYFGEFAVKNNAQGESYEPW